MSSERSDANKTFEFKRTYVLLTEFEVRTGSYGPSFSPSIYGPSAKRASHIVGEPGPKNERFVHPSPQKRFDSGLLLFDNS